MTLDQHLSWLLHLMAENPEAWKAHCWHRAKELARESDLADLPQMLAQAMQQRSKPSTPEPPCTEPPT